MKLAAIALAGALGAVTRYALSGLVQRLGPHTFPTGTLFVNALGCFLMGLVVTAGLQRWHMGEMGRTAIIVGFLGAFTTFSAFGYETLALAREGEPDRALLNVLLSLILCVGAVWLGSWMAGRS